MPMLVGQAHAKLGEEGGAGFDSFGGQSGLEIVEDASTQLRIRLGARNEIVQCGAGGG